MPTLRELLQELKQRREDAQVGAPTSKRSPGSLSFPSSEAPAEAWLAERSVNTDDLSAGELCNMLEGLTPSGKDKRGRQVSFVEKGTNIYGNTGSVSRVGGKVQRISK
jgi:hypothetical protein